MKKILDWDLYCQTARNAIAEGCVLLENKGTLPLKKDSTVSVFGRIQSNYYKSGTGSGGKVNVTKVWNIVEGLEESGLVKVNQELKNIYTEWEKDHPYDEGMGWGKERWSQDEMPLTERECAFRQAPRIEAFSLPRADCLLPLRSNAYPGRADRRKAGNCRRSDHRV